MKINTIFLLFCIIITGCYKNTPKSDLEINDVVPQETNNTELMKSVIGDFLMKFKFHVNISIIMLTFIPMCFGGEN